MGSVVKWCSPKLFFVEDLELVPPIPSVVTAEGAITELKLLSSVLVFGGGVVFVEPSCEFP